MATPVTVLIDPAELERAKRNVNATSGVSAVKDALEILLAALKPQ